MDPNNLYVLFYRRGYKGASTGFIAARNLKIAEEVGKHYCNSDMGRQYIRVEHALLASEDDLPEEKLEELLRPPRAEEPVLVIDDPKTETNPQSPKAPAVKATGVK